MNKKHSTQRSDTAGIVRREKHSREEEVFEDAPLAPIAVSADDEYTKRGGDDDLDELDRMEILEEKKYPPRPKRPFLENFSFFSFFWQLIVVGIVVSILAGVVYLAPGFLKKPRVENVVTETPNTSEEESPGLGIPEPIEEVSTLPRENKIRILETETGWLNVRASPSVNGTQLTRVLPGEEYVYTATQNGWYQITLSNQTTGWVLGEYTEEVR